MFNLLEELDNAQSLMKPNDLAKLLGVSTRTVARWSADKVIPTLSLPGGGLRFCPAAIKKWYIKQNPGSAR